MAAPRGGESQEIGENVRKIKATRALLRYAWPLPTQEYIYVWQPARQHASRTSAALSFHYVETALLLLIRGVSVCSPEE